MTLPDPSAGDTAAALAGMLEAPAVIVDPDGRVVAWNAAAEARFGLAGTRRGQTPDALGMPAARLAAATRLSLVHDEAGRAATLLVWVAPAEDRAPASSDHGPAATGDQVTLQRARALARLAPGVVHEFKNRLGGVKAFASVLRTEPSIVAEFGAQTLAEVEDAADRSLGLVNAFLELARARRPLRQPVDLPTAVQDALRLAEFELLTDVALDLDLPRGLPEVEVDPSRLHQALAAVLINVIDAMGSPRPTGGLRVSARVAAPSAPVELRVADTAPLVAATDRPHLFDPYPPAGCSPRSGLDLAVARGLLAEDGGDLRYEVGADGANTLLLMLPTLASGPVRAPESGAAPEPAAALVAASGSARGRGTPPLTVLVCDDEDLVLELMRRTLELKGFTVVATLSGSEALAQLDAGRVDVIVADNRMREMSGPELHTAVAERHPELAGRFILMSGDELEPDLVAFAAARGVPVLGKPFRAGEIESLIRTLGGR